MLFTHLIKRTDLKIVVCESSSNIIILFIRALLVFSLNDIGMYEYM